MERVAIFVQSLDHFPTNPKTALESHNCIPSANDNDNVIVSISVLRSRICSTSKSPQFGSDRLVSESIIYNKRCYSVFSNEIKCVQVQSDDSKNGNQKYSISRCMLFVCQLSKEFMLNAHTECEWFINRHVQYNRLAAIGTTAWADKHNETNWWSHWWVNIWRESRIRSGSRSRRAIEFEECCFISGAFRVFGIPLGNVFLLAIMTVLLNSTVFTVFTLLYA